MASALRDGSSCHESCEAVATSEPLCLAETTSAILVGQMDQRIHLARSVDETETSGLKESHCLVSIQLPDIKDKLDRSCLYHNL